MPELTQTTIEVTGFNETDKYVFRIPDIFGEIRVGLRAADVRSRVLPGWRGDPGLLDYQTMRVSNGCAIFEEFLVRATEQWPFSPGPGGGPIVDSSKFGPERFVELMLVADKFEKEVSRFRTDWLADKDAAGTEAVAGQPVAQPESVSG